MTMSAETIVAKLVQQEHECGDKKCDSISIIYNVGSPPKEIWRHKVVDWCFKVVDYLDSNRDIVCITMNILDRFLSTQNSSPCQEANDVVLDKKRYEVAVMTCFLIAMKLQGNTGLSVNDMIKMSMNSITSKEILNMGKDVIKSLTWNFQVPTPARFAEALLQLLPSTIDRSTISTILDECVFQLEVSVFDRYCSAQSPSLLAWMALENIMDDTELVSGISKKIRSMFRSDVARITGHVLDDILRYRLCRLHAAGSGNIDAVRNIPTIVPRELDFDDAINLESDELEIKLKSITTINAISHDDLQPNRTHEKRLLQPECKKRARYF